MAYLSIPAKILLPNGECHQLAEINDDPYNRLRPLENQHAFLPIGWGEHRKAPVLKATNMEFKIGRGIESFF
jgi:hypothetical protein